MTPFNAPLRNSESETITNKFQDWIQSPDGGLKGINSTTQHAQQVRTVIRCTDKEENFLSVLNKSLLLNKFLGKHVKENNYTPSTIKAYLMSVRHFCKFLLSSENALGHELGVEEKRQIDIICDVLKRWSASYRKLSNKRMLDKMEQDFQNLITPEKVVRFEHSTTAREAVKILGELSDGHDNRK